MPLTLNPIKDRLLLCFALVCHSSLVSFHLELSPHLLFMFVFHNIDIFKESRPIVILNGLNLDLPDCFLVIRHSG